MSETGTELSVMYAIVIETVFWLSIGRVAYAYFGYPLILWLVSLVWSREVHTAYLRFPVIMPTEEKKRELCAVANEHGLEVSPLYPIPISEIPELHASFEKERFPGAEVLAERLVPLPVHYYVDRNDIENICSALRSPAVRVRRGGDMSPVQRVRNELGV